MSTSEKVVIMRRVPATKTTETSLEKSSGVSHGGIYVCRACTSSERHSRCQVLTVQLPMPFPGYALLTIPDAAVTAVSGDNACDAKLALRFWAALRCLVSPANSLVRDVPRDSTTASAP